MRQILSPEFDASGYPTEETLVLIKTWPHEDFLALMEFVQEAWRYPEYIERDGDFFYLATGGWSGNESLIGALQENFTFWAFCWEQSHRGGKFVFKIPKPPPMAHTIPHPGKSDRWICRGCSVDLFASTSWVCPTPGCEGEGKHKDSRTP